LDAVPATNVTDATEGITPIVSVVSVAENVATPAVVDEIVKLTFPDESVVPEAGEMESVELRLELRVTDLLETEFPWVSIKLTVIVAVEMPSAITVNGDRLTVEAEALTPAEEAAKTLRSKLSEGRSD
jgi:hypothetical protein